MFIEVDQIKHKALNINDLKEKILEIAKLEISTISISDENILSIRADKWRPLNVLLS